MGRMLEDQAKLSYLENAGNRIAYRAIAGSDPGVFFLPGFASDMTGSKAVFLADKAIAEGFAYTALDYSGHGQSGGDFKSLTLKNWLADTLAVFDAVASGPQIVVGSSMGGWLALHLALARPAQVAGIIGIAAAPDFTEDLIWNNLDAATRTHVETAGYLEDPSDYGPPMIITHDLIMSGRDMLLLRAPLDITCPVHLMHGMQDKDVPWQTSLRIAERLVTGNVQIHLIKDGQHRLSRQNDLELLADIVNRLR